jgi:hypothetical protein
MRIALIIAAALLAGCYRPEPQMPRMELPKRPLAAEIPCEPLSDGEIEECLKREPEAREVCRKVEHNEAVCTAQQNFTRRLYQAHDNQ